jgi:hypothetical protein
MSDNVIVFAPMVAGVVIYIIYKIGERRGKHL